MGGIFSLSHFFKNRKIDRLQDAIVSIVPAFKSCISGLTDEKKEDLLENAWSHNVNHNDLDWVLENLWKPNTIAIFNAQSESSDSGLRFQTDNDSNEELFLLIAYKNYGPTTCLQKATISDEIEKASFFLNDSSKNRKVCLLVVATNVGCELSNVIGDSVCLTLTSGKWVFKNGQVKKVKNGNDILNVPKRMEVIVLGQKGLISLLGEITIQKMMELADKKNQVNEHANLGDTLVSLIEWRKQKPKLFMHSKEDFGMFLYYLLFLGCY
jgi:hypothetical protein